MKAIEIIANRVDTLGAFCFEAGKDSYVGEWMPDLGVAPEKKSDVVEKSTGRYIG